MDILSKPQSRASLNRTITTLADQLHRVTSERDEALRERDAVAEVLHAALDVCRSQGQKLERTEASLTRLIEVSRNARTERQKVAA